MPDEVKYDLLLGIKTTEVVMSFLMFIYTSLSQVFLIVNEVKTTQIYFSGQFRKIDMMESAY